LHGHGTHVAGSVLGSGVNSGSDPRTHSYDNSFAGAAPEADLIFQSLGLNAGGMVFGPLDTADLFRQAYPLGARVHTNSWGGGPDTYTATSASIDEFIYNQPDLVVLFAAGNSGADNDRDGVVDPRSLGDEAVAKNVITVGACENNRPPNPQFGPRDPRNARYGGFGFAWPPFDTDFISDNPGGLAAFSSRGPTADGRIKPDVVAPGTNVVSVWARNPATTAPEAWDPWAGPYSDANPITKYCFASGTSMATPLTAGACALVREFFMRGGYYGRRFQPTAALVKAILINGARDLDPGQYGTGATREVSARPDFAQGWGRVDLANCLAPQAPRQLFLMDGVAGLTTGQFHRFAYRVRNPGAALRITLVWTDPPGTPFAGVALVNNLDLRVTDPSGNVTFGNNHPTGDPLNNVEGVDIPSPQVGEYEIRVIGTNVPVGAQSYALVVTGAGDPVGGRFPDVVPPVVRFQQPVPAAPPAVTTVSGATRIEIFAADDRPNGIDRVVLWLDDTRRLKTMYAPPYVFLWNTAGYRPGRHTLKVEAYDFGRNRAEATLDVTLR
ncbi:MAG: S8 family serine peptidase, partial [Armatimonadota bacterium]|nr:S8 family serine peptidase [Armatimonadota bacterium]